tara:strand:- start:506 stop:649 length:144 start_codon:yes stop_codon:yes gene_type:complete
MNKDMEKIYNKEFRCMFIYKNIYLEKASPIKRDINGLVFLIQQSNKF